MTAIEAPLLSVLFAPLRAVRQGTDCHAGTKCPRGGLRSREAEWNGSAPDKWMRRLREGGRAKQGWRRLESNAPWLVVGKAAQAQYRFLSAVARPVKPAEPRFIPAFLRAYRLCERQWG
jgi:hypothetical protein